MRVVCLWVSVCLSVFGPPEPLRAALMPPQLPKRDAVPLPGRQLQCILAGGLTNMEAMVENCVLLAKMLRRALVAPRPIVDLGNSTWASPANPQLEPLPFGSLWDAKHFKRCARQHGVDVLDEAAQSPNARIGSSVQLVADPCIGQDCWHAGHAYHQWGFAIGRTFNGLPSAVQEKTNQTWWRRLAHLPIVAVTAPFYYPSSSPLQGLGCVRPARRLAARVERVHARLLARSPDGFDCVHARVEEDWLRKWCAAHGNEERRASATVEELRHGLCRDGTRVSSRTYLPVKRLVQRLRALLPPNRTLYVSTGAPRAVLADLEALFDVQMRLDLEAARPQRTSFMNYADALVDRGVCAQGLRFYSSAVETSSFASLLLKLRREAGRARQCWVNGRHRPPILEEETLLLTTGVRAMECGRLSTYKRGST